MPSADVQDHPVIFFDGVCNLCNGFVQFVIRRDPGARFRFAPLQSEAAESRLGTKVVPGSTPDSILLFDHGVLYQRSTAVLRIARGLRAPWPLLFGFVVVPRPVRDWVYDFVATRRYRWFGRRDTCMLPTPDLARRFLS
ncbi:MAG TPA: thiol-disulfide oxidoreductase DCC family protein [Vicinamibacterales bacterium]|nr:thiol-disulfide oxidoreductase DCC family protein [Vicinamibacterales bacterium]